MRNRARWPKLLLAAILACSGAAAESPNPGLRDLRAALQGTMDDASLRARLRSLAPALAARLSEQAGRENHTVFDLELAAPLPARAVVAAFGLSRPYAVAGDAHQEDWTVGLWVADLESRWSSGIAVHTPHIGAWAVEMKLAGRPAGPLPRIVAGSSPAYDLETVEAAVVALRVERWSSDWQQPEHLESPSGPRPPQSADSRAVLRSWIDRHKGYGAPSYAEDATDIAHVFVAWNIPWSGRNTTDYWIYCLQESGWSLLTSATFQPRNLADRAVFDRAAGEVVFLEADGRVAHRASVARCRFTD